MNTLLAIIVAVGVEASPPIVVASPPIVSSAPPPAVQAAPVPVHLAYPTRRSNWSYPGSIRSHVLAAHSREVDPAWIAAQSDASLRAFHSDHHEGRVKWAYVTRRSASTTPKARSQDCPSGNCPTGRPGLFQRWLR